MKRCKVKFCGMRTKDSSAYAVDLGIDYLGFIVEYPKSKRSVSMNKFLEIASWLRKNKKGKYKIVAVTVDMDIKNINKLVSSKLVDVIQLHGNEKSEVVKKIKGIEVWKAQSEKRKGDLTEMSKLADRILLDSGDAKEKASNSSGAFDALSLYKKLSAKKISLVLSGGINVYNVAEYLEKLEPEIIDISRGIETLPGRKSKKKMKEFMEAVNDFYQS